MGHVVHAWVRDMTRSDISHMRRNPGGRVIRKVAGINLKNLMHFWYSETCLRRSPLGPGQLAVIQRWPAYKTVLKIS